MRSSFPLKVDRRGPSFVGTAKEIVPQNLSFLRDGSMLGQQAQEARGKSSRHLVQALSVGHLVSIAFVNHGLSVRGFTCAATGRVPRRARKRRRCSTAMALAQGWCPRERRGKIQGCPLVAAVYPLQGDSPDDVG